MKHSLLAAAVLALVPGAQPAVADACLDRFVKILTDVSEKGPVKIHVTQQYKGAPETENVHYSLSGDHWMTQMLKPANAPWSLGYKGALFTSSDKGKTWRKMRAMPMPTPEERLKALKKSAKTARNTKCGTEMLDGAIYDTVEGDYTFSGGMKIEYHHKYWITPDTGFIRKAVYTFRSRAISGQVTQFIEKAPGLTLPKPE